MFGSVVVPNTTAVFIVLLQIRQSHKSYYHPDNKARDKLDERLVPNLEVRLTDGANYRPTSMLPG